jgi:hypothetical protein
LHHGAKHPAARVVLEAGQAFEQPAVNYPSIDYETASYDGFVSYTGVVSGEQVAVSGEVNVPGVGSERKSKILFNEAGLCIAIIVETEATGVTLLVFDAPLAADGYASWGFTSYLLQDDQAVPHVRMSVEDIRMNEPLDERLFDVESIEGRP